jgi:hypothetical protein
MRWLGYLCAAVLVTGCALGDVDADGPDTMVGLTETQLVGTWIPESGSGYLSFSSDGTVTVSGMPFAWFRDEFATLPPTSLVDGTGTWTVGPDSARSDDLPDLVLFGVDELAGAPIKFGLQLHAQCDGSRVILSGGATPLAKDGLGVHAAQITSHWHA